MYAAHLLIRMISENPVEVQIGQTAGEKLQLGQFSVRQRNCLLEYSSWSSN